MSGHDLIALRPATIDDADHVARHAVPEASERARRDTLAAWVAPRLAAGSYLGTLAIEAATGRVLGGAGAILLDWGPTRANPGGTLARVNHVFVDPAWRRQGLARRLVADVMARCEALGVREFALGATEASRALYGSLGFEPYAAEMRRRVR